MDMFKPATTPRPGGYPDTAKVARETRRISNTAVPQYVHKTYLVKGKSRMTDYLMSSLVD